MLLRSRRKPLHSNKRTLPIEQIKSNCNGAVLIEFVIGFITVIVIMCFFIDAGLTYMRYNLLVFTAQKVSRSMAVNFDVSYGTYDEEVVEAKAILDMQNFITLLGFKGNQIAFAETGAGNDKGVEIVKECPAGAPPKCFLVFNDVQWTSFSFAKSALKLFNIKTTAKSLIEDPCYVCECP